MEITATISCISFYIFEKSTILGVVHVLDLCHYGFLKSYDILILLFSESNLGIFLIPKL